MALQPIERAPVVRSAVEGSDLDEAKAMYEAGYNGGGFRAERTDLDFSYRYRVAGDATMTFRSSTFLGSIRGRLEASPEYIVSWLHSGTASLKVKGETIDWVGRVPWLFPSNTAFDFDSRDYHQSLIAFDGPYLERLASEIDGAAIGPIRFHYAVPPRSASLAQWCRTVGEGADLLLRGEPTELQMSELTRQTATALLATFPRDIDPLPAELLRPRNARLRAAVDYLHERAAAPFVPGEVAAAVGLTPRGLQQAFQRRMGMTPTAYLRRIRLDRVRAELEALSPAEATVGGVAAAWGFTHLGRFAAAYRERFGESPRETLAR